MHVRKSLQINVWLSMMTAVFIMLMLLVSWHYIRSAMEGAELAGDIISGIFERNNFRNDYLQTNSERAKKQWLAKQQQIGSMLDSAAGKEWSPEDRVLIREMLEDYESMGNLFAAIVAGREKSSRQTAGAIPEREDRLLTQLIIRSYDTVLHARQLQEASREHLFTAIRWAGLSIFSVLAVVVAAVVASSWKISRLVTDRMALLRKGAAAVGEGDLDHRIGLQGDDEFTELSQAFDGMTIKLNRSYRDLEWEIGERKQAEEEREQLIMELQRSRTLLSEAEKLSHTGAWQWSLPTDSWTFSDEWLSIHGVRKEMLKPEELLAIAYHEDRPAVKEGFDNVRNGLKAYQLEHRIVRQDTGEIRIVRARGQFVKNTAGDVVKIYGFAQDITRQKRGEEELRKTKDELEIRVRERTAELSRTLENLRTETDERIQAVEELRRKDQLLIQQSRLAAMGEMLVNISHQWRQPLNVLGLILQELNRNYQRGTFSQEYLTDSVAKARQLIAHMSQTIDDFRNFLKPDKVKVNFHVGEVVETTLAMLRESLEEMQVDLQVRAEEAVFIEGYRNEFAQVVMNILVNARDVFRERGIVKPRITVKISREDGKAVVTIADNAGGIAGEILDKVFDPYFTTKAPDKGTGIGLFMSRTIIETNMGGKLSVRNTGEGAEFRIEV